MKVSYLLRVVRVCANGRLILINGEYNDQLVFLHSTGYFAIVKNHSILVYLRHKLDVFNGTEVVLVELKDPHRFRIFLLQVLLFALMI